MAPRFGGARKSFLQRSDHDTCGQTHIVTLSTVSERAQFFLSMQSNRAQAGMVTLVVGAFILITHWTVKYDSMSMWLNFAQVTNAFND